MTKYYRVRTQEQWDWLVSKLNVCRVEPIDYPMIVCHEQGRRNYSLIKYHKGPEPIIEVSQMMEESRMEDYVTIKGEDLKNIEMFRGDESKGNLREFWDISKVNISKSLLYPKVRMSVAEKKEFDELKSDWQVLICAFDAINEIDYPRWFSRLNDYPDDNDKHQIEFARAWADPSLIEVIPDKKWNVKVPISHERDYYYKDAAVGGGKTVITNRVGNGSELWTDYDFQFTAGELKHYGLDSDLFEKVEVLE